MRHTTLLKVIEAMSRAGRKRTQRGHLAKEIKDVDGRLATSEQPHRRSLPASLRLSEKAATVLGRLNLTGAITDAQHEAGQRFQVTVGKYRASIGTPGNGARGRGYDCVPWWDEDAGRMDCMTAACECRRRYEAYWGAFNAVLDVDIPAVSAVALVAVDGKELPEGELACLRAGLTALVGFYGLDIIAQIKGY